DGFPIDEIRGRLDDVNAAGSAVEMKLHPTGGILRNLSRTAQRSGRDGGMARGCECGLDDLLHQIDELIGEDGIFRSDLRPNLVLERAQLIHARVEVAASE